VNARTAPSAAPRRWRRPLRAVLLLSLLLALLLVLGTGWLLRSGGGRDYALARLIEALPADSLRWQRAEGALDGPLVLHGVSYTQDGVAVTVARLELDLAPAAAFSRQLRIESLRLEQVRVVLPPADPLAPSWPQELRLPSSLTPWRLPFALQVDALALRDLVLERKGQDQALLRVTQAEAAGSLVDGRLELERLQLASDRGTLRAAGTIDTGHAWLTRLGLDLELLVPDAAPLPVALRLEGDLEDLRLEARSALPQPATLTLHATGGLAQPRWTLQLDAPQVDPRRLGGQGEVLSLALRARGDLQQALWSGEVLRGATRLAVEPSQLRYADGALLLEPLLLVLEAGRIEARGRILLAAPEPVFDLQLSAPGWRWSPPDAASGEAVVADLQAQLEGPLHDYALRGEGKLARGDQRATLTLAGRGDERGLRLESLRFASPGGALQGSGELGWTPIPSWRLEARLQHFDPSWLLPDWPGAVDAGLRSEGEWSEEGPIGTLRLDPLGGTLRGRALAGRIEARLQPGARGSVEGVLSLGASRLRGSARWSDTIEANLSLQPLNLADVLQQGAGTLEGELALSGARRLPQLQARLDGRALAFAGVAAETLRLRAERGGDGQARLALSATGIDYAAQRFERLQFEAQGDAAAHRADLTLVGAPATLALQLAGGGDAQRWRGTLQALRIEPRGRPPWRLRAPAALEWNRESGSLALSSACIGDGAASLCAQVEHGTQRSLAQATLEALPLATLDPFLAAEFEAPVEAHGVLTGEARFERGADGPWQGRLSLRSAEGGLRLDPAAPRELLAFRDFSLQGDLAPARAQLRAAARIGESGTLRIELASDAPLADDGALQGRVDLDLRDLTFLELWSDRVVAPKGSIVAGLAVGGSRSAPALEGLAELRGFTAELPELGITLREGGLRLRSRGSRAAAVEGEVTSGGGTLRLAGSVDLAADAAAPLELRLTGSDFAAAALPELGAVVAPDLTLTREKERWKLRGSITVPSANLNLERLEGATAPSSDVVVVDEERSERAAGRMLYDSDVDLVLGDKVRLAGFGLKGRLDGRIAVRERPGRATVARGALQVSGNYKAYGQDLEITRGRLAYASTPLDDPALDIRAKREIDDITVGVQVRGTARLPELTLWSEPALDQAEQLSYLVLGRPMRSASQTDGAQLSQAAAAFGGNLLAQKLGARMGLDEVGVSDSRALGGAALTVGKFLSPRLYVSYGVALFDSGQVVTFKYILSRVWSVQVDSGSENRAALNYRLER
jgi:translocation and assembly module TamB